MSATTEQRQNPFIGGVAVALAGFLLFLGACQTGPGEPPEGMLVGDAPREQPETEFPEEPPREDPDPSPSPDHFESLSEIDPDERLSFGADDEDWYKDGVFYHIWINAFNDTTGDGVGDIQGIIEKLDYLDDLGVTGLWLSPFFESASTEINLHMYDTTDHYRVDPRFGTNEDMKELIAEAHDRGIRLLFDWVPNHISNRHPWFEQSADLEGDFDQWFIWRYGPESQNGPWGQQVWHEAGGAEREDNWYYGVFWSGMPDLNFRHQPAKDAMTNVAIHWLNKGFDGMRVDAVKYLYSAEEARDGGEQDYQDLDETFEYFQAIREQVLDEYTGKGYPKFMVAENWTNDRSSLERYMVDDGEKGFHMTLDFPFAYAASDRSGDDLATHWEWVTGELAQEGHMGTFLSNHDNVVNRPASVHDRFTDVDGEKVMRSVVAAQLLGPGTPFLYYGNEVGMQDAEEFAGASHADRRHRQPFEWDRVEEQDDEPESLLNHHRELTSLRAERESLRRGDFAVVEVAGGDVGGDAGADEEALDELFAFTRSVDGETSLVVVNFGEEEITGAVELSFGQAEDNGEPELAWHDARINGDSLGIDPDAGSGGTLRLETGDGIPAAAALVLGLEE